jgi:hypothetical protein
MRLQKPSASSFQCSKALPASCACSGARCAAPRGPLAASGGRGCARKFKRRRTSAVPRTSRVWLLCCGAWWRCSAARCCAARGAAAGSAERGAHRLKRHLDGALRAHAGARAARVRFASAAGAHPRGAQGELAAAQRARPGRAVAGHAARARARVCCCRRLASAQPWLTLPRPRGHARRTCCGRRPRAWWRAWLPAAEVPCKLSCTLLIAIRTPAVAVAMADAGAVADHGACACVRMPPCLAGGRLVASGRLPRDRGFGKAAAADRAAADARCA